MRLKNVPHRAPAAALVLGIVAAAYIGFPIAALASRVPWTSLGGYLADPETLELLKITLGAAGFSTVLATVLGTGLALWVQHLGRFAATARLLSYLPLAMPPVVSGLALTAAIGRRGWAAGLFDAIGLHLAFTFPGVVAAHVFVALPYVVVAVDSALRQIDREILDSARGVGIAPSRILTAITLPAITPAIVTGAALAFARSMGEFGTTITFAGSMPGITRTMPLGIYLERETSQEAAYALSAILICLALMCLAVAGLPGLVRRPATPTARSFGPMNVAALQELTAARGVAPSVSVTSSGVTTTFPAGQVSTILGSNGSGKSTLMHFVAGRLHGAAVTFSTDTPRVVMLTQRPGLPRTATVASAIDMVTRDRGRTTALADAAGLTPLLNVPVPQLSGGQAAQVALIRALAARPDVLVLDEPLAAVDVASATRWRQALAAVAAGRTTLLVTHNALDVATLSDHSVVMEAGKAIAAAPTAQLLASPPNQVVAQLAGLNLVNLPTQTLIFSPQEAAIVASPSASAVTLSGVVSGVHAATTQQATAQVVVADTTVAVALSPEHAGSLTAGTPVLIEVHPSKNLV